MTTTKDKTGKKTPSAPLAPFDPWAGWQPRAGLGNKTPHDFQEQHSPTETVELRGHGQRTTDRHQRRLLDARLWDSLTPPQQDAALEIAATYQRFSGSLGYKMMDPHRLPGGQKSPDDPSVHQTHILSLYFDWAKTCQKQKHSHAMTVDILVFGHSCRQVDKERRQRRGTARQNLVDCLNLYCDLRGWPKT